MRGVYPNYSQDRTDFVLDRRSDNQAAITRVHTAGVPAREQDPVAAKGYCVGTVPRFPDVMDSTRGLAGAYTAAKRMERLENAFTGGVNIGFWPAQF